MHCHPSSLFAVTRGIGGSLREAKSLKMPLRGADLESGALSRRLDDAKVVKHVDEDVADAAKMESLER